MWGINHPTRSDLIQEKEREAEATQTPNPLKIKDHEFKHLHFIQARLSCPCPSRVSSALRQRTKTQHSLDHKRRQQYRVGQLLRKQERQDPPHRPTRQGRFPLPVLFRQWSGLRANPLFLDHGDALNLQRNSTDAQWF